MISFWYKNHKGEEEFRRVEPHRLEWIKSPGFKYPPGWFLTGLDIDHVKEGDPGIRSFALSHIQLPAGENFTLWEFLADVMKRKK